MRIDLGDLKSLTLGEAEDFEEYTQRDVMALANVKVTTDAEGRAVIPNIPMRVLTGIVWILGRRSDPKLTPEDVRNMSLDELQAIEWVGAPGLAGNAVEVDG